MSIGQSSNYQTLSGYSGSLYGRPEYNGVEYDYEIPDNQVIGSPGGVDSIHGHYTKGFNGRGNTSSDIYAGQAQRYNAGVYGNLYQTGQEAGQYMGYYPSAPDYQFWQNQEPQQYSYTHNDSWAPNMSVYGNPGMSSSPGIQKKVLITEPHSSKERYISGGLYEDPNSPLIYHNENYVPSEYSDYRHYDYENPNEFYDTYESMDQSQEMFDGNGDFELIPLSDDPGASNTIKDEIEENQEIAKEKGKHFLVYPSVSPWLLFLFFLLAFIAFDFWAEAAHLFIRQKIHTGSPPSWKSAAVYALIVSIAFVAIIWYAGVPVSTFEAV